MLDYKDIITRQHYALEMSGKAIAETLGISPSGVNDFLRAFKDCKTLSYPLAQRIELWNRSGGLRKNPAVIGRGLSYEMPDYE